jgi:hypothetical protein
MRWLTIDPGEDTGWTVWQDREIAATGTDKGWQFVKALDAALTGPDAVEEYALWGEAPAAEFVGIERIVMEDFALYPKEARSGELDWDRLRTVRFIGAIELLAQQHGIKLYEQPAKIKDQAHAAGADELFDHPLYENRHQNDSKMHGVVYLLKTTFDQPPEEIKYVGDGPRRGRGN